MPNVGRGVGYTGPGIPDVTRVSNPRQPDTNNYLATNHFQFFSNITIIITNSTYKPKYYVRIKEAFPVSLSGIDFTSIASENEPVIATATFAYMSYDIRTLDNITGTSWIIHFMV